MQVSTTAFARSTHIARSGSMCGTRRAPLPAALHSRPEQRACSGTLIGAGWHRSPPLWAEIDANVQVSTTAFVRSAHIARSGSMCGTRRAPLPFALHSRSEPRACSGTHWRGWHRSPPLWAEIDANVQGVRPPFRSTHIARSGSMCGTRRAPCPSHCTLAQSRERAVAPTRDGWHRSPPLGRRSMQTSSGNDRLRSLGTHRPKRVDVAPTSAVALRTALSLRAASVQWHPHWRGVASIAAAPGGDRCERASEYDRLRSLGTHRPKRVDVWHPTSALARSACIDSRASQCMAPSIDRRCPPHCTLAQSREREVAPTFAMGGIDRRRSGRRSMQTCKWERPPSFARHTSPAFVPTQAGEAGRCVAPDVRRCPPHCTLAQSRERAVAPAMLEVKLHYGA